MYDEQCNLVRELGPHKENPNLDNSILYFAYSNTEKRIGACLHDFKLCFWDQSDNFTFEKSFPTNIDERQIYIMYVDFCTKWLTVDQSNNIYIWNLEKETYEQLPKRHKERITEVKEISQYKIVAASSLDKKIILWDIMKKHAIKEIKLKSVSAHSL